MLETAGPARLASRRDLPLARGSHAAAHPMNPSSSTSDAYALEPDLVWVDGRFRNGLRVRIENGRVAAVEPAADADDAALRLPRRALIPGFVNAHSHSFQRLIRGRTQWRTSQPGADDFWSWRQAMYDAALQLSPEDVFHVARWCFLEMMQTGITAVGEFHYLHHRPDGIAYDDPNELARQVLAAADAVGIRIALLNVCYATGGIGAELGTEQRRFRASSLDEYLDRTDRLLDGLKPADLQTAGVAPHSIRAVPRDWLPELHAFARDRDLPLHMHVSEQTAEVDASVAEYGLRPVELLAEDGILDGRFTAIHATHLTDGEIGLLSETGAIACACPTTERDLGDGFLRGRDLLHAGVEICLGTDSHTSLDFLDEMRLVEYHERLRRRERVVISGDDGTGSLSVAPPLLRMATGGGARSLRINAGEIAPGCHADLVAVDLDHPSLLGADADSLGASLALSATPDVVRDVWVGGVRRLADRTHPAQEEAARAFAKVARRG